MSWLRSNVVWLTGGNAAINLTSIVLALVVAFVVAKLIKRRNKVRLLNQLPGPKGLPLLGSALEVNCDNVALFKLLRSYGDLGGVVRVWLGFYPFVLLSSPEAFEVILSSQKHIDKNEDYDFMHPWLGTGLLTSTGSKWHARRKMLTPAFHFSILDDFVDVFNKQSSRMIEKLRQKSDLEAFDIFPFITLCTLDIICEAAMGQTINAQDKENSEYVRALKRINYIILRRTMIVWQYSDFMFWLLGIKKEQDACLAVLHKFTRDIIKERKATYRQAKSEKKCSEEEQLLGKGKRRLAFLDLLLEASDGGKSLSDEDIREEVDTFMFRGHDTTTSGINWALYLLGRHPEIQTRVQEELDGIFGTSDRHATLEDLRQMKYMENCIKEAHRLFPSVPYIGRKPKEDIIINNQRVPAGVSITLMIFNLHRNPDQFPNPEKFDPDRFLPENAAKRHPFAYVPFSAGPRNCIGQRFALLEEKVVVSNVLRHFRVESVTPEKDLQLTGELVLLPRGGNLIKLLPRSP